MGQIEREKLKVAKEKYGKRVCQFLHTFEDSEGKRTEVLSIYKKYVDRASKIIWDGEQCDANDAEITLLDKDGKRVARSLLVELAHRKKVVSQDIFAYSKENASEDVRYVPLAGAAMIANYVVSQNVREWRSMTIPSRRNLQNVSDSLVQIYRAINTNYMDLAYSHWDEREQIFFVRPS